MVEPTLILSREAARLGALGELRSSIERGDLHRVRRGAFVSGTEWGTLPADARYRTVVRAAALLSPPGRLFSHDSAAAMFRLPSIGAWPSVVHVTAGPRGGGSARAGIRWHSFADDPSSLVINGVRVTSLARTLVDIATSTPFVRAVAMADDALRATRAGDPRWGWGVATPTRDQLLTALDASCPRPGSVRAHAALEFSDGGSGSPNESVCRVQLHALGLPMPVLQHPLFDEHGLIGVLDMYWPHLRLGAEIDGASKYGPDRRYGRDLSPHQLLLNEKKREDRMRAALESFTRLDSALVADRRALGSHMAKYGLVPEPRRVRYSAGGRAA
jgi:hypothetical protein